MHRLLPLIGLGILVGLQSPSYPTAPPQPTQPVQSAQPTPPQPPQPPQACRPSCPHCPPNIVSGPYQIPPTSPTTPPSVPAASRPLTVANVHKEPVTIYKIVDGKLIFTHRVPAGEAVDIYITGGEKLAATFSNAPYCENFTPTVGQKEIWLLRPATPVGLPPSPGVPSVTPVTSYSLHTNR